MIGAVSTPMQGLVTVFGGSGFVGRYAVQALARAGWRVRVAVRQPHLTPSLMVAGSVGQVQSVQANIRMPESVKRALDGAEACVNLVGVLAELGRQRFDAVHAEGAATVAQHAATAGCRAMVQVSAIGADAASPSAYARSKAQGEAAVRDALPDATVLRPSIVFGPEDDFFNRFGRMAQVSPVLPLIGGGKTRFQPVYAADVGRAIAACLDPTPAGLEPAAGRTFELGGPGVYSFRALMELICRETVRGPALVDVPFPIARLIGKAGDLQAKVLPLAPLLTLDQVELLTVDNVVHEGMPGLAELGVEPTALEAVVPTYLWTFRRGGQFAQPETANA